MITQCYEIRHGKQYHLVIIPRTELFNYSLMGYEIKRDYRHTLMLIKEVNNAL